MFNLAVPLALLIVATSASPVDKSVRAFDTYRLPNATIPTHYDLYLDTNVHLDDLAYSGTVKISIQVVESTNQIVLHSTRSVIVSLVLRNSNQLSVALKGYDFDEDKDFLVVDTAEALSVGSSYVLEIDFTNSLDRTDAAGFYRSSYVNAEGVTKYLGVTQFESTDARSAFPCYDEPGIKTTYKVHIASGLSYNARSNAPALGIQILPEGKKLTTFQTTPRMQTYLLAFLVSDFVGERQVVYQPHQIAVSTFARPTANDQLTYSVDASVRYLREMEIYFDQTYALSKIDNAAISVADFSAGAMENWGLVTYRETYILFDPETDGEDQQVRIVGIVGHEYAHQFFGNLLAPEWWSYLWLNEGFAQFYQYYVAEYSHPELNMRDRFASQRESALSADASETVRPMTYYVETTTEISRLFDTVAYAKSASVLRMFNYAVTEPTFQKGLRYYIQQNKEHGVVNEENLFDSLEQAVKEDSQLPQDLTIHEIFRTWSNQAGAPVVTVTRVGDTDEFLFNQERYYTTAPKTPGQESWWIPISFFTPSSNGQYNSSAAFWLPPNSPDYSQRITLAEGDYLTVNPLARGYYRVNYDEGNWENIIATLYDTPEVFHRLTRSQLVDDAMNLAHAGKLDYFIAFQVFDYLNHETDFIPWSTASSNLNFLKRMLRHDSEALENLETYSSMLASNLLATYGFEAIKGESADAEGTRLIALEWACSSDDSCQAEAAQRLRSSRRADSFVIGSTAEQKLLCSRMRKTVYDEFATMLNSLQATVDPIARSKLIDTISCVEDESSIDALIDTIKSNNVVASEKEQILRSIYRNSLSGLNAVIELLDTTTSIAEDLNINNRQLFALLEDMADYTVQLEAAERLVDISERFAPTQLVSTIQVKLRDNQNWVQRNGAIVSGMLKTPSQINFE
ncbi:aminopeptidase N-like [Armigeres subalbatus]|uniref:aminopeptidase N-like n=1 Tax=Armigeres subalbatus TaxID=124917 RepID=UPI002ED574AD